MSWYIDSVGWLNASGVHIMVLVDFKEQTEGAVAFLSQFFLHPFKSRRTANKQTHMCAHTNTHALL